MNDLFYILYWVLHHFGIKGLLMQFMLIAQVCILVKNNLNSSIEDKIYLKCDVFDGSVVNGIRESILFSFILDKPCRCKFFSQPETVPYK